MGRLEKEAAEEFRKSKFFSVNVIKNWCCYH